KNKILEFDLLEFDLNEEGFRNIFKNFEIEVFLNNETEITYHCDNIFIEIKNNKIKAPYSKCKTLMEQSFISDLRYMIPEILNYNIDHTLRLSDILNNTMEYFIRSLKFHKNSFKLEIFEMELLKKQNRVSNEFILKTDDYAINYNSASSGIKSTSIIEAIISYLTQQTLQERKNNFKNHLSRISKSELDNITKDFQTSIFIEEPELSLFPQDQQKILYFILKSFLQPKVNPKECNKLNFIISTHSPFILYCLSNILLGAKKHKELNLFTMGKVEDIIPKELLYLDIEEIEIYKLEEGKAMTILDKKEYCINTEYIDKTAEDISQDYISLLNLENEFD
ncbi:TPA: AAA family ATPase, partial [Campylobacter jejuni]|nr:AAA family ATPase [Campylobacter jejuni]